MDVATVDTYLERWDRFAQGANDLVPYLRDHKSSFEAALTRLFHTKDPRAPSRLVFYAVVQVGGGIATDSELGAASAATLGSGFPILTTKEGRQVFFAADLYRWWEANGNRYAPFPLFEAWRSRDFARNVVLPMYRSTAKE